MTRKGLVHYFIYCAAGGSFGLTSARTLKELEQRSGLPIAFLASMMAGASVGAIHASGLTLSNPENPGHPSLSADEYSKLFKQDLSGFLPYKPGFYAKQFFLAPFHAVQRGLSRLWQENTGEEWDPYHYPTAFAKGRLKEMFNNAKICDAITGLVISAYRMTPAEIAGPCDFIRLPDGVDQEKFLNTLLPGASQEAREETLRRAGVSIADATLASMACPTVFPAHEIPGYGFFADMGGANNPAELVAAFKAGLPPEDTLRFIWAGTGSLVQPVDPRRYNKSGFLGTIEPMTAMVNVQVGQQSLREIARIVGPENVVVFDPACKGERDILDTSPEGLSRLEALSERMVHEQDALLQQTAEDMGTAYLRRSTPDAGTAFRPAVIAATRQQADKPRESSYSEQPLADDTVPPPYCPWPDVAFA